MCILYPELESTVLYALIQKSTYGNQVSSPIKLYIIRATSYSYANDKIVQIDFDCVIV